MIQHYSIFQAYLCTHTLDLSARSSVFSNNI